MNRKYLKISIVTQQHKIESEKCQTLSKKLRYLGNFLDFSWFIMKNCKKAPQADFFGFSWLFASKIDQCLRFFRNFFPIFSNILGGGRRPFTASASASFKLPKKRAASASASRLSLRLPIPDIYPLNSCKHVLLTINKAENHYRTVFRTRNRFRLLPKSVH